MKGLAFAAALLLGASSASPAEFEIQELHFFFDTPPGFTQIPNVGNVCHDSKTWTFGRSSSALIRVEFCPQLPCLNYKVMSPPPLTDVDESAIVINGPKGKRSYSWDGEGEHGRSIEWRATEFPQGCRSFTLETRPDALTAEEQRLIGLSFATLFEAVPAEAPASTETAKAVDKSTDAPSLPLDKRGEPKLLPLPK